MTVRVLVFLGAVPSLPMRVYSTDVFRTVRPVARHVNGNVTIFGQPIGKFFDFNFTTLVRVHLVKQQREIMIGHQFVAQFAILSESSLEFIQRQGTTVIAVLMPEQFAPIDATKRIRRRP
jgi:hypothetical protein